MQSSKKYSKRVPYPLAAEISSDLVLSNRNSPLQGVLSGPTQAIEQAMYYMRGIFRGDEHPTEKTRERKMNPLQQVTYLAILNILLPAERHRTLIFISRPGRQSINSIQEYPTRWLPIWTRSVN